MHQAKIARDRSPSSVRLSKAGQSASSPGCPATTFHDHEQRTTHRRAGAAHTRLGAGGCDASFLVRVTLLHGQDCRTHDRFRNLARTFTGSGPFPEIFGAQPRRQAIAEQPPFVHFKFSVLNAPNLDRGGHDEIHETPTFGTSDDR